MGPIAKTNIIFSIGLNKTRKTIYRLHYRLIKILEVISKSVVKRYNGGAAGSSGLEMGKGERGGRKGERGGTKGARGEGRERERGKEGREREGGGREREGEGRERKGGRGRERGGRKRERVNYRFRSIADRCQSSRDMTMLPRVNPL